MDNTEQQLREQVLEQQIESGKRVIANMTGPFCDPWGYANTVVMPGIVELNRIKTERMIQQLSKPL